MKEYKMKIVFINKHKTEVSLNVFGDLVFATNGVYFSSGGHKHFIENNRILRVEPLYI